MHNEQYRNHDAGCRTYDWYHQMHEDWRLEENLKRFIRLAKLSRSKDYIPPRTRVINVNAGIIYNFKVSL